MDLEFTIKKQVCKRNDEETVVNLSNNYLELSFDFKSDDWQGLTKFALFHAKDETYRVPLHEDKVVVPFDVLTEERFSFMVYGVNDDELRITTNQNVIYLLNSGYTKDVVDDITEDDITIVEQIYVDMDKKANTSDLSDVALSGAYTDLLNIPETFPPESHEHSKADITDFNHTHELTDITDFTNYMLDYTSGLLTRVNIDCDTNFVKTGDTISIRAFHLNNGVPKPNQVIEFYKEE